MTENARAFFDLLVQDESLRAEFNGAADADTAFEVAKAHVDIDKEELFDALKEIAASKADATLGLDDLEHVAGGSDIVTDEIIMVPPEYQVACTLHCSDWFPPVVSIARPVPAIRLTMSNPNA